MLQRMIFWGWKMRWSWDFDSHGIYDMIYLKLDRIQNCFNKNGHCVWNRNNDTKGMKKLRVAKELAKRLFEDDYIIRACDEHEVIWGECRTHSKPIFIGGKTDYGSSITFSHDLAITEKQIKQCRKDYRRIHSKYDRMKVEDRKQLFQLLEKNLNQWWD